MLEQDLKSITEKLEVKEEEESSIKAMAQF